MSARTQYMREARTRVASYAVESEAETTDGEEATSVNRHDRRLHKANKGVESRTSPNTRV